MSVSNTWQERFSNTHPTFQAEIRALATKHQKTVEQVYGWWLEYAAECDGYGQSAILFEFERWYAEKLSAGGAGEVDGLDLAEEEKQSQAAEGQP